MRSGNLHIRKAINDANWIRQGYGGLDVLPKTYVSDLLPFYFKHLLGGGSPGESNSCKTFSLEKLKEFAPTEIVETTISLTATAVKDYDVTGEDAKVFYYQNGCGNLGFIAAGAYRYKIVTFDDKIYYSEPFRVCFDLTHLALPGVTVGDFNGDFNNDFLITETT